MRKYILITGLFFLLLTFTGCYTVIWSPEDDFPTTETYEQEYYDDGYYAGTYYGDYGYYYQYPWWLSITPPTYSDPQRTADRDENPTMERLRNRDGSRNSGSRESGINNPPVTRSGSSGSGSSKPVTNNPPAKENTRKTEATDSNKNTNTNSNTSTRPSSNDSNNGRNNDGGRNNGGRR